MIVMVCARRHPSASTGRCGCAERTRSRESGVPTALAISLSSQVFLERARSSQLRTSHGHGWSCLPVYVEPERADRLRFHRPITSSNPNQIRRFLAPEKDSLVATVPITFVFWLCFGASLVLA
jgi:hypothetical protein